MNENKFEMSAFALVSILLTVRIIFMYGAAKYNAAHAWELANSTSPIYYSWITERNVYYLNVIASFELAIMIMMLVFQILLTWLFIKAWKDFGWKLYRTVGANKNLIGIIK